jgi:hypothetical protein
MIWVIGVSNHANWVTTAHLNDVDAALVTTTEE